MFQTFDTNLLSMSFYVAALCRGYASRCLMSLQSEGRYSRENWLDQLDYCVKLMLKYELSHLIFNSFNRC